MRDSDRILADDFTAAGAPGLAERARSGEWNDFFGSHDLPQVALIDALNTATSLTDVIRKRMLRNVMEGKYDASPADAAEWASSPDGKDTFSQLRATTDPNPFIG